MGNNYHLLTDTWHKVLLHYIVSLTSPSFSNLVYVWIFPNPMSDCTKKKLQKRIVMFREKIIKSSIPLSEYSYILYPSVINPSLTSHTRNNISLLQSKLPQKNSRMGPIKDIVFTLTYPISPVAVLASLSPRTLFLPEFELLSLNDRLLYVHIMMVAKKKSMTNLLKKLFFVVCLHVACVKEGLRENLCRWEREMGWRWGLWVRLGSRGKWMRWTRGVELRWPVWLKWLDLDCQRLAARILEYV